jgi:hypothetical protein
MAASQTENRLYSQPNMRPRLSRAAQTPQVTREVNGVISNIDEFAVTIECMLPAGMVALNFPSGMVPVELA